ncbi:hypothetical protein V8B97DRAFT_1852985, partial [Scleroderma yunnanense]
ASKLKSAKEMHWRDWLEGRAGNDLWISNKYITNSSSDGRKTCIPTLKGHNKEEHEKLATSNEEKSDLLACSLFPHP